VDIKKAWEFKQPGFNLTRGIIKMKNKRNKMIKFIITAAFLFATTIAYADGYWITIDGKMKYCQVITPTWTICN